MDKIELTIFQLEYVNFAKKLLYGEVMTWMVAYAEKYADGFDEDFKSINPIKQKIIKRDKKQYDRYYPCLKTLEWITMNYKNTRIYIKNVTDNFSIEQHIENINTTIRFLRKNIKRFQIIKPNEPIPISFTPEMLAFDKKRKRKYLNTIETLKSIKNELINKSLKEM